LVRSFIVCASPPPSRITAVISNEL